LSDLEILYGFPCIGSELILQLKCVTREQAAPNTPATTLVKHVTLWLD